MTEPRPLSEVAREARSNSERWFPALHDPDRALVPLPVHYALALAGEVGEVANLVKKALRRMEGSPPVEDLSGELADVFIYLMLLADECGVDLLEAYERKAAICEERWG